MAFDTDIDRVSYFNSFKTPDKVALGQWVWDRRHAIPCDW